MPSINSSNFRLRKAQGDQTRLCSCGIQLVVGIYFMILAFLYVKEPCDFPVIYFLLSLGTVLVSSYIISQLSPNDFIIPILAGAEVGIWILGLITILSKYSHWQYTNPELVGFCPLVPFRTAFIYLIVYCVWVGLVVIGGCFIFFYMYYKKTTCILNIKTMFCFRNFFNDFISIMQRDLMFWQFINQV